MLNHQQEEIADLVFTVIEHLYNSENAINENSLRNNFQQLCYKLGIETDLLEDPNGLCVVHYKHKQRGV